MLLWLLVNVATILFCALAQDVTMLKQRLAAHGVSAVYPVDDNFTALSQAYNMRFNFTPVAIVFPASIPQVSVAVVAGAAQKLEVVARSGGHSYIANGLGGNNGALVVDMRNLKAITVRSSNNTAIIETGNRLGNLALALNAAGRAIPHGTCSYIGIGGHSGYGGFGFASRMWGLMLDTVKSATVVLANGTIVPTSAHVNTDLFWAICGASPSFGIVASIEVQTFKAPSSTIVFEYTWDSLDIPTAATAISSFQTFARTNIPPEFGAELVLRKGPSRGTVSFAWTAAYYGDTGAHATVAPFLKSLPKPSNATITPGSYINSVLVLSGKPLDTSAAPDVTDAFYTKSLMTPESAPMSAAAITAFVTYMATQGYSSETNWYVEVELYGGSNSAVNAVPLDATAFAKRDTLFTFQFHASSPDGKPPYPSDGFTFMDGMVASILDNEPANWPYGAYLNYMDDRLANAASLYYGTHYARLKSIKASVDPQNVFRFPVGVA
ncbi:glucooligosaccharide oxidase [Mycena pura]|uniref:Glucooligosaccharide oxidase n=1 Tax=Mycena pura TaxID=153505 RepID=A0AAD6XYT6_9AGAR|nr:glucooligosaccharide oxidase [Mycena pura]